MDVTIDTKKNRSLCTISSTLLDCELPRHFCLEHNNYRSSQSFLETCFKKFFANHIFLEFPLDPISNPFTSNQLVFKELELLT